MAAAKIEAPMTAAEFLAWDARQTVKHEFVRGRVLPLGDPGAEGDAEAGASKAHVTVSLNVATALRHHLRGTGCHTFITGLTLRVDAADAVFSPDVTVTCSAVDAADPMTVREPVLLVEVLSPATAAYDRGEKFTAYRRIPTLREYLLIDPDTRRCDLYRLGADGLWVLHPVDPGQAVRLASVDLEIPAATLWDEVPAPD